jgi:hypothetical protein
MEFINQLFYIIFHDPIILYPASVGAGALMVLLLIEYILNLKEEIDYNE